MEQKVKAKSKIEQCNEASKKFESIDAKIVKTQSSLLFLFLSFGITSNRKLQHQIYLFVFE